MNWSGGISPTSGFCQRISASTPIVDAAFDMNQRLIVQDEFARAQPAPQSAFHQQMLERRDIHLARIEAEGIAACLLGLVHRGIGIAQQGLEIRAVDRIKADPQ